MRKVSDIVSELKKHKENGDLRSFSEVLDNMSLEEIEIMEGFCRGMLDVCESNRKIIEGTHKINDNIRKEFQKRQNAL